LAGFYSKDLIVELACQNSWGIFIVWMMFICLGLTVLYSVRLVFFRFSNLKNGIPLQSLCEGDKTLLTPVIMLTVVSMLSGPSLIWLLFPHPSLIILPPILKLIAIMCISFSILIMLGVSRVSFTQLIRLGPLSNLSGLIWFLPLISGQSLTQLGISKRNYILKILDQGWLEYYTNFFSHNTPNNINRSILPIQYNSLKIHFVVFIMWMLLVIVFLFCFYSLT
jgi:hypothetical protein